MPPEILEAALKAAEGKPGQAPATPGPAPAAPTPTPAKATPAPAPPAPQTPPPTTPTPPPANQKGGGGIKDLREAYERQNAKVEELNASLTSTSKDKADAYAKLARLEEDLGKANKRITEDLEPRAKRLADVEKKLQEREEMLRVKDYTATGEWHEKYVKPIADTHAEITDLLGELRATVDGNEIPATVDHFNHILAAPSLNEAARRASELFGEYAAPQIISLRARLNSLQRRQQEALKNAQLEAIDYEKRVQSQSLQHREAMRNIIFSEAKRLMGAEPEIFAPKEDDTDTVHALANGQHLADLLLDGAPDLTPEGLMSKVGEGRARIIKSFVLEKQLSKAKTQLAEAIGQLKAYQRSEPEVEARASTRPTASDADESQKTLLEAAMKLARRI